MLYHDFQPLISAPRLQKYLTACNRNTRKSMALYRANIRLSTEMFSILSLFEIALRNTIDNHYRRALGENWLFDAMQAGTGFLRSPGCEKSLRNVQRVIEKLDSGYTQDKAVPEFTFGFWVYKFASKEFAAAGSTLLNILPKRPRGANHTIVHKNLIGINGIRNRIAHHEPICFSDPICISSDFASEQYKHVMEMLAWMGINQKSFLFGADRFLREKRRIDLLRSPLEICEPPAPYHAKNIPCYANHSKALLYKEILQEIYRDVCCGSNENELKLKVQDSYF